MVKADVWVPTPRWSILGGTRSCAAHQALASCCACCWGGECAVPAVSAAWPDWRRRRNVQTPGPSQLRVEREDKHNYEFLTPSAFLFRSLELNLFSQTVYHSRKITIALSQLCTTGLDAIKRVCCTVKKYNWHKLNHQLTVVATTSHPTWPILISGVLCHPSGFKKNLLNLIKLECLLCTVVIFVW